DGSEPFTVVEHTIDVAGGEPERLTTRATRWGPILRHDWRGRPLALRATWLDDDGADLDLVGMMTARSVADGLRVAHEWAGPSLSWALADSAGRVGWTLNGPLPRRRGFDGSRPVSWRNGDVGWDGFLTPPTSTGNGGVVRNANDRSVPETLATELGRVWMRPLRGKRIDDLLRSAERFDERALAAMQLDTRT